MAGEVQKTTAIMRPMEAPVGSLAVPTVKEFSDEYNQLALNVIKGIGDLGRDISNLNNSVEQEQETLRVRNDIFNLRNDFEKKWSGDNINITEDWEKKRKEEYENLKKSENEILSTSNLNDISIKKESVSNNMYHKENEMRHEVSIGNKKREQNIESEVSNLNNFSILAGSSDTKAQRDIFIDNINNTSSSLKKYGVSDEKINQILLKNFNDRFNEEVVRHTQNVLKTTDYNNYEQALAEVEAVKNASVQKYLSMLGGIDTLKDTTTKQAYEVTMQDNLKNVDVMIENKRQSLEYKRMREEEILAKKELIKNEEVIRYLKSDKNLAENEDEDKLLTHRLNPPNNTTPILINYDLSEKVFGTDYKYQAGTVLYGTETNPKVIELGEIGRGKSFETPRLLSGAILEDYKSGVKEIQRAGGTYQEIKKYTDEYLAQNVNPREYGVDVYSQEYRDIMNGLSISSLKQIGLDPKKFTGDVATKGSVDENIARLNKNPYYDEGAYVLSMKDYLKGVKQARTKVLGMEFGTDRAEIVRNVKTKLERLNKGSSAQIDNMAVKYVLSRANREKDFVKDLYSDDGEIKADVILSSIKNDPVLNGEDEETLDRELKALWDMYIRGVNYKKVPIKKINYNTEE